MNKAKVGLALGAGGAKGLAHIGVLQVLIKEGIPIDIITGSSMGAVIGALYAVGAQVDLMAKLAMELNNSHIVDFAIPKWGLIRGKKAHALLRLLTHNKNFDQLNIPFGVVATDLERGKRVVFREGKVADALRASISIPGIVIPFCKKDNIYVDGAVTDRVPAQLAREMGADIVIAVDLQYHSKEKVKINNIYDVIIQAIEIIEKSNRKYYLPFTDVIIKPNVSEYNWTDFHEAKEIINIGKEACIEVVEEIKEKINNFSIN